jgi:hypothetical protein
MAPGARSGQQGSEPCWQLFIDRVTALKKRHARPVFRCCLRVLRDAPRRSWQPLVRPVLPEQSWLRRMQQRWQLQAANNEDV